jgi:putative membrane protein
LGAHDSLVSDAEAQAIRAAVAAAEQASAGEIVPVLVDAADDYELADWKGATLGALLAALGAAIVHAWRPSWGPAATWLVLPAALGALAGALSARYSPPLRRLLIGAERLDDCVEARAFEAFLHHGVFRTRDRSGILILVALFEHRVRILADEGIHAAVPAATWEALARDTALAVRGGRPGDALARAVERCGTLLSEHGPRRRADDANELPDAPLSERI